MTSICDVQKGAATHKVTTHLGPLSLIVTYCSTEAMENPKSSNPLVLIIHITHHAGTFLCRLAKANHLRRPPFVCMLGEQKGKNDANWTKWQSMYDVVSWEYRQPPDIPLATHNWESDQVISVLIVRDPLDRLLARDRAAAHKYGRLKERTQEQWWAYANDGDFTKNFALRILSDGDGKETGLHKAKELVGRMTYVLDQACLNENLLQLAKELGWNNTDLLGKGTVHHTTARERLGNDTLWEFLRERNANDIALYEWSKKRSLVVCDTIDKVPTLESDNVKIVRTLDSRPGEIGRPDLLPQMSSLSSQWNHLFFGFILGFLILVVRARTRAKKKAAAYYE